MVACGGSGGNAQLASGSSDTLVGELRVAAGAATCNHRDASSHGEKSSSVHHLLYPHEVHLHRRRRTSSFRTFCSAWTLGQRPPLISCWAVVTARQRRYGFGT